MPDAEDPPRPPHLTPLADVLPPLLLGTATFNTQYVDDPASMPYRGIVRRALVDLGVTGFDTSPYYGPSEALLGEALEATGVERSRYFLETKAGRVHGTGFDYSTAAVQASVRRSLQRLRTPYVDLVFAHDAEFVRPDEVVTAVRALRALRAEGVLRYVGISGFPVDVLAALAESILEQTGEPVDAVLSYGHCTVQNTRLLGDPVARLHAAGVSVVLNASLLNMGLLTTRGVDNGPQATWHPSPPALRDVSARAAAVCRDEKSGLAALGIKGIEQVALRYALDVWAREAEKAQVATRAAGGSLGVGASVLGVTSEVELDETALEWWSVLDGLRVPHFALEGLQSRTGIGSAPDALARQAAGLERSAAVKTFVEGKLWPVFGDLKDFAWASPEEGWVNELNPAEAVKTRS
ncbi:hypothetical protein HMPREF1624_03914 [Sporothrix schenckii ATCC 58251]|uniref:NADP-dependent oxidoreductase domain-containing protein n=1 Tax=Sporothrix schenckii (strain ATCC 58251 / de Perez 2211183) TaxID=1391915 RepID=U7Q1H0_SPOS1|nr:hypothetical protein HMPREF1624_03914 [Sporothrix schenckii ATCC 58251]